MKRIVLAITAMVVAVLAGAAPASAHTPTVTATCSGLSVGLVSYEGSSHNNKVTVTIDGTPTVTEFAASYTHTFSWSPNGHTWSVVIDANRDTGNPTQFDRTFTGSVDSCQASTTTSLPAPSTSTTTTTQPLATTTTSSPASDSSAPPETSTSSTVAVSTSTPTTTLPPRSLPSTSGAPTTSIAPTSTAATTTSSTSTSSTTRSMSGGSTNSTSGSDAATTGKGLPVTCFRAENCQDGEGVAAGFNVPAPLYGLVVLLLLVGVPLLVASYRKGVKP